MILAFIGRYLGGIKIALAIALLCALGWQYARNLGLQADLATERAARATEKADATREALAAAAQYRAEEQRRIKVQGEIAHEADQKLADARADLAAGAAVAERLRQRVAALAAAASRATEHPEPAEPSASQRDPGAADLLADMQRRIDEASGIIAQYADRLRIAGAACEAAYDTLTR